MYEKEGSKERNIFIYLREIKGQEKNATSTKKKKKEEFGFYLYIYIYALFRFDQLSFMSSLALFCTVWCRK